VDSNIASKNVYSREDGYHRDQSGRDSALRPNRAKSLIFVVAAVAWALGGDLGGRRLIRSGGLG